MYQPDSPPINATNSLPTNVTPARRRGWLLALGWALWIGNIALLVGLAAWILWDGRFAATALAVKGQLQSLVDGGGAAAGAAPQLGQRVTLLWGLGGVAVVTTLGIFVSLFAGAATHRRLRSWLAFTMLVAAWLTLFVAWREIAWQGQRLRLRASLSEFEAIAASLRENWPAGDGERAGLGTFMAYPQGRPRMLLVLTSDSSLAVSAVERTDDGAIGFELRGDESGAWLEWHPAGSTPRAFTGGLEGEYDLRRAAPLGGGWYLVRYR
jgi:hypothetical protein